MMNNGNTANDDRFWSKVNKGGPVIRENLGPCWMWTACTTRGGYGRFAISATKWTSAHRYSWTIANARLPLRCILHHCDNRACVRPEHLYEGTHKENAADMVARGRCTSFGNTWNNGERSPHAKLTSEQVLAIRAASSRGELGKDIAAAIGISKQTVSRIIRRERWAWL